MSRFGTEMFEGRPMPVANELRLLCNEMLRDLGRWLRAAGHDTVIAAVNACQMKPAIASDSAQFKRRWLRARSAASSYAPKT
jgi:uncharacterized protein with PIN domain